jgi:copper resistance protein B
MPEKKKPAPEKKAAVKKAAPKKAAPKKAAPKRAAAKPQQQDPHAGHQVLADQQPDPHAGHQMQMEPTPDDPHAGHQMPALQADPHTGHDMGAMAVPEPQPAPPPPEALTGPVHAADLYWDHAAQQRSRNILRQEHGDVTVGRFLVDRAETRVRDGRDGYLVDIQAWYGGDIDKLWLKGEVDGVWGKELEHAEVQALWSHAIGPWFDLQAGVRYDPQPGPNRTHLVLGVEGLAPYWWEVEGAVFLSNKGDVTARAEGEYDLRITQKLILQPRAEINLALQDVPELAIGSGLSDAELGLRLRYEFSPQIAPYVGVEYEHAFGGTRDFRRAEGDKADGWSLLTGVRLWF